MDIDKRSEGFPLLSIFTALQVLAVYDGYLYLSDFDGFIELILGLLSVVFGVLAAITTYALFKGELWAPKSIFILYLIGLVAVVIAFGTDEEVTLQLFFVGLFGYLALVSSMIAYVYIRTPRYSNNKIKRDAQNTRAPY